MDKQEEFIELVRTLQRGYSPRMRTVGNERLAFVVVMMAVTKQSLSQVLQFRANQIQTNRYNCVFNGVSAMAKRPFQIFLPVDFPEYLEGYYQRYQVREHDLIFALDRVYITRLLTRIIRENGWSINLREIRKLIPYAYQTASYRELAGQYLRMLCKTSTETWYVCTSGSELCAKIKKFVEYCAKMNEF